MSSNTWNKSEIGPWSTEWNRAKANRLLLLLLLFFPKKLAGHSKHLLQHKRTLETDIIIGGQHQNQSDYILCSKRWRSSIESAKTRPGADCGSNHELPIAKFRLKLKKAGKTIRPLRYDLICTPYDYTLEMRTTFKGLDLIDRGSDELWLEVPDIV